MKILLFLLLSNSVFGNVELISFNLKNFKGEENRVKPLKKIIFQRDIDIYFFQEVKDKKSLDKIFKGLNYNVVVSKNAPRSQNTGLVLKKEIKILSRKEIKTDFRSIQYLKVKIKNEIYHLVNVHLPSLINLRKVRTVEHLRLYKFLEKIKNELVIIGGDFNMNDSDEKEFVAKLQPIEIFNVKNIFLNYRYSTSKQRRLLARGTYFYKVNLSFNWFDQFYISKKGFKKLIKNSFTVLTKFNSKKYHIRSGAHFGTVINEVPKGGIRSDHFPIYMELIN